VPVAAHSDRVHELVEPTAEATRIATGFEFVEGPVWSAEDRHLLFSDIPAARIYRWTATATAVWRSRSNMSNGLTYDRQELLIACEHATSRVTRTEHDGTTTVVASHYQDKELNSPNDVVVARDGSIVFTDPTYGRRAQHGVERPQELDFQGVYRVPPRGAEEPELLLDDFAQPNGLCFSPDESLLYVDDSEHCHVRVFDWRDGLPQNGRLFLEQPGADSVVGKCDGMKCDARGNVWVTGPGGVWIVSPEGEHLGTIELPEKAANLNWGADEWRTLFVTASSSVYRIETLVGAARAPYMR
jgi:gluconolactonase